MEPHPRERRIAVLKDAIRELVSIIDAAALDEASVIDLDGKLQREFDSAVARARFVSGMGVVKR